MPVGLALVGPAGAAAAAAAATVVGGVVANTAAGLSRFQNPGGAGSPPADSQGGAGGVGSPAGDAAWPRLPVPNLPPLPPPGGGPSPGDLAGAAAAAAAGLAGAAARLGSQLWGYLNGRPEGAAGSDPEADSFPRGRYNPTGANVFTIQASGTQILTFNGSQPCQIAPFAVSYTYTEPAGVDYRIEPGEFLESGGCENLRGVAGWPIYRYGPWHRKYVNGTKQGLGILFPNALGTHPLSASATISVSPVSGVGIPYPTPPTEAPAGFVAPEVKPDQERTRRPMAPPAVPPAPSPAPQLPPQPQPPGTQEPPGPLQPQPQPPGTPAPQPQPAPGTTPAPVPIPGNPTAPVPPRFPAPAVPATTPGTNPRPAFPRPAPEWRPTGTDGLLQPQPQPGPTVTRPGSELIGDVAIPNRPPAPTLVGIAQEVGRIEQKLAVQLRQPDPPGLDLLPLLQQILEALTAADDAGVYELGGPCERNQAGEPIPFDDTVAQFDWGGTTSALGNLASRVDALAELIQYHKLLRQPTCSGPAGPPIGGEWVTVNFQEVA